MEPQVKGFTNSTVSVRLPCELGIFAAKLLMAVYKGGASMTEPAIKKQVTEQVKSGCTRWFPYLVRHSV